jgi:hypothetical protein
VADAPRTRAQLPGWVFVVVPMVVAALLVGGVAIAVRSSGGDDGEGIEGPATELPAVVAAAEALRTSTDPLELGARYGEVTRALAEGTDRVEFAARYDRLPDAEAALLGRTLGAIQGQLSPTDIGGARTEDDREDDLVFALALARGVVQALEPDATPREQALAVLPFSVQDIVGFDEVAELFATGDLRQLTVRIDTGESGESGTRGVLSDAGAAEVVSSVAYLIGQRLPTGEDTRAPTDDFARLFTDAYNAALPT